MRKAWPRLLAAHACVLGLALASSPAATAATPQGFVTGKAFLGVAGTSVASLTGNARFPNQPDVVLFPPYFEWNATGDIGTPPGNWADNYGAQLVGWFHAPATGNYVFYLASDDNASLYLSTDATAANKKLIAQETAYSNPREYLSSAGSSTVASKDSSQFATSEWPNKDVGTGLAVIRLQANQAYYIEAIGKEGGGGDNLSVAVMDPGGAIDASAPIPGQYLSSDRATGPLTIVEPPQPLTVDERAPATFRVVPDGTPPYAFQWRRGGTDIPGATNISYTLGSVAMSDSGAVFSVVVGGAQGTATSGSAGLTVTPDTTPPRVVSAKGRASLTEVVVVFSEAMDPATAGTTGNYQIARAGGSLAVTGATLSPDGTAVTLTTAAQTLGTKYTLTVSNLKDTAATPNSVPAGSKVVFFPMGKLVENSQGFIVFEAENFDRNLDGLWVPDTTRGVPSGGISMVNPNGAGGSEGATKLEYDIEFKQAATYVVWFRASGANGNDDSAWFHLDGARPEERAAGNGASMTGFQPQTDFVWRSDSQDGPDPFTVDIPAAGVHSVGLARREDGSFFDKFLLTTDTTYTPTGLGPAETREGVPAAPTVALTAPAAGQKFTVGTPVALAATASGDKGLEIVRVQFSANGVVVGEATASPFAFQWANAPEGIFEIRATAIDEIGGAATSGSVTIEVAGQPSNSSARIAWVSFHASDTAPSAAAATAGFTKAPDVGYTDLLASRGHKVTRVVTSGSPNTALLNAFDLVIISRSVPSGDYQDPPETLAWNGITAPTMILGGYVLRNSRLGYVTGATIPDTVGPVKLTVNNPAHPVFAGIALDAARTMVQPYADVVTFGGTVQRGISVNTDPVAGNGTVLATLGTPEDPAAGGTVIAEWAKGAVLGNAAGDTLGGQRLVFLTGSREQTITSEGAGIYDLRPDGARMFLNAVDYLAGTVPPPDRPTLAIARTATGVSITFTGTLQAADTVEGAWTAVAGATSPYAVTPDQARRFYRTMR